MITIFTPTYNRGNLLYHLFESLCKQTNKDFEWLIIDDGSVDDTQKQVEKIIRSADFPIRYYKKDNGGKHRAINMGVKLAAGELFFIVDSDDTLTADAIERLNYHYSAIKDNNQIAGVCGLRIFPDGRINGLRCKFGVIDTSFKNISKYLYGDKAEAYRTSILKKFPFPEFDGEKFISEGVVWNRIAKNYKLRFFFEPIYISEYLSDGLTKSIVKHHRNSPLGSLLLYKEKSERAVSFFKYVKACINYYRYSFVKRNIPKNLRLPMRTKPFAIIGFLFYLKDSLLLKD